MVLVTDLQELNIIKRIHIFENAATHVWYLEMIVMRTQNVCKYSLLSGMHQGGKLCPRA